MRRMGESGLNIGTVDRRKTHPRRRGDRYTIVLGDVRLVWGQEFEYLDTFNNHIATVELSSRESRLKGWLAQFKTS